MSNIRALLDRLGIINFVLRRQKRSTRTEALRHGTHMGKIRASDVTHPGAFSRNTPEVREASCAVQDADDEAARAARYRPGAVQQMYGTAVPALSRITPAVGIRRPYSHHFRELSSARLAGHAEDGTVCQRLIPDSDECGERFTAGTTHLEDRGPHQELHVTLLVCPRGHTLYRSTDGG
ncbi:hypothetical protein [Nocardiopsis synnemataformans]|uniref:hypothetical protein n=1 Tax=Nocardiopsis synnemataformans TaxID=61305 RepID=UPI003EB740EC